VRVNGQRKTFFLLERTYGTVDLFLGIGLPNALEEEADVRCCFRCSMGDFNFAPKSRL